MRMSLGEGGKEESVLVCVFQAQVRWGSRRTSLWAVGVCQGTTHPDSVRASPPFSKQGLLQPFLSPVPSASGCFSSSAELVEPALVQVLLETLPAMNAAGSREGNMYPGASLKILVLHLKLC